MARRDWYCEDVLSGKIDVDKIWEDDRVLAFYHPNPQSEIHVVVVPKSHITSILDAEAADGALLTSMILAIQNIAHNLGLDKNGFYVRTNAASEGVTPHMHWHICGQGYLENNIGMSNVSLEATGDPVKLDPVCAGRTANGAFDGPRARR
jgi:histidine triad (HIT) family protein